MVVQTGNRQNAAVLRGRMSNQRQRQRNRQSQGQQQIGGILGVVMSGAQRAQRLLIGDQQQVSQRSNRSNRRQPQRNQWQSQQQDNRRQFRDDRQLRSLWNVPMRQRPVLIFGKGNVSEMLRVVEQLQQDSPAAAVGLMDFVAQHQIPTNPDYQIKARNRLTTLLITSYPTQAAYASQRVGQQESKQTEHGELTSLLSRCELDFLSNVHGVRRGQANLSQVARQLESVANAFATRDSLRRQASARIILADIYLRQGSADAANHEMSKALVLIGTAYATSDLIDLAKAAYPDIDIISETYRETTATDARRRALELSKQG